MKNNENYKNEDDKDINRTMKMYMSYVINMYRKTDPKAYNFILVQE